MPQIVYDADTDREIEVTICESICGGANEAHGMPKHLTLLRFRADGSQQRMQYLQVEVLKQDRPEPPRDRPIFYTELEKLIKDHSKENADKTPDSVLLSLLDAAIRIVEANIVNSRLVDRKTATAQTNV